jgi:hypothetical protein
MAKIIDKIRQKKNDIGNNPELATENRKKAVAAITGGIKSKHWKTYMEQFADTPDQLMRLLGTDGTAGVEGFDTKRAYMLGNATCGEPTFNRLDNEVEGIDDPA